MALVDPVARKAYLAQYYLLHKDEIKARSARWQKNNPEKVKARVRKYALAHPEKVREIRSNYAKKPESRIRIRRLKMLRRSIERVSENELTKIFTWEQKWRSRKWAECYWCRTAFHPRECHTDHIIPLSRHGKHELSNVVISCAKCNRKKGSKHPNDWLKILRSEMGVATDIVGWC